MHFLSQEITIILPVENHIFSVGSEKEAKGLIEYAV